MIKRLAIYLKEMYPIIARLILALIVFFEIYFVVLLNSGVTIFNLQVQEIIGAFTVFSFLLMLRIADDIKDYETDLKLFPERPLPSGRVKKRDLIVFITSLMIAVTIINFIFMNNIPFYVFLILYGIVMSLWFFQKSKIQKNLFLALVTHNPVQMVMNVYIISFTCIKYNIPLISFTTFLAALTLYFPALIWEISRKIRSPKEENKYITYSKLYGYKKATKFVLLLTIADIVTNIFLVINLNIISVIALIINVSWMVHIFIVFIKDPEQFSIVSKVVRYTYIQEGLMLATVVAFLLFGKI